MLRITSSLAILTVLAFLMAPHALDQVAAQTSKKQKRKIYQEFAAGEIPTEWGELHSVVSTGPKSYALVFRDQKERIRIISLSGNRLPNTVTLIGRKY